jgi:hypothetical protein
MVKFVNLTPHPIVLQNGDKRLELPSAGVARCSETSIDQPSLDGWPVYSYVYGPPVGLPDPEEGTYYVVSKLVMESLRGVRDDILAPDTGSTATRDRGNVVSVRGFVK